MKSRPTKDEIIERMEKGHVPGVSIAYLDSNKIIPVDPVVAGVTDVHAGTPGVLIQPDTIFGAASLSKPVFSYLVLKLISDNKLSRDGKPFNLDTPISEILPVNMFYQNVFDRTVSNDFSEEAKKLNVRNVLSHMTGIPVNGAPQFVFEPGTQYAYGDTGLYYLQKAIEMRTEKSLETLAQEEIFTPLKMTHSSFYPTFALDLLSESSRNAGKMYFDVSSEGLTYEVIGLDDKLKKGVIPWNKLPEDFPKNSDDIIQAKEKTLPRILEQTSLAGHTPVVNHGAKSLNTTASDYANLVSAWMNEKDCSLVRMSVEPTAENQNEAKTSRYILTETGFFHYNQRTKTVHRIEMEEAAFTDLQNHFAEVSENTPKNILSTEELTLITRITGHTNALQEAFRPAVSLTKDQWAIDMGVPLETRQHLAWGLGLGLQTDDTGEVVTAFHSGDMNQWRGWVAMDIKAKTAVIYLANGNAILNASGHGYGHVLADVIVAPEVNLNHGLDWFFQKFGLSRTVEPDFREKEALQTAHIHAYVGSRLPVVVQETKEPVPSKTTQKYRHAMENIKSDESASNEILEGTKATEGYNSISPFNTMPKPLNDKS